MKKLITLLLLLPSVLAVGQGRIVTPVPPAGPSITSTTTYSLAPATATVLGGIKVGSGLTATPDGILSLFVAPTPELGDYSQLGTIIDDGGGPLGGNQSVNSAKVFDNDINTFYDANGGGTGMYVGRNLGVPKAVNQMTVVPRQNQSYTDHINGSQLQYSTNGTTWTTFYTINGVTNATLSQKITVNIAYVTAQYWRLYFPLANSFGNVAELTIASVAAAPTGGGSYYTNTAATQSAVQDAITAAATNSTIKLLPGSYPFTGAVLFQAKTGLTLDGGGQVTFTGNTSTFILFSGLIKDCRITGIKFVSTLNNPGNNTDAAIYTDQTIRGNNLEIDHCYFTCPTAKANGIGWVPVDGRSGQATNTNVFRGINIHHNVLEDIGRCGIELLNQNNDFYRVYDLTIADNYIARCGLNDGFGMGISLSGAMQGIKLERNGILQSKFYSIEVINCRNVDIAGNYIETTIALCAGISVNAQTDNNGINVVNEHVTIAHNTVRSTYSPIQMTDVDYITIVGNDCLNNNSSDISNGGIRLVRTRYGSFMGNNVLTSSNNALTLNISSYWAISGNYLSNKLKTADTNGYELLWLYNTGTTNNRVSNNIYEKNPGHADINNYVNEAGGATGNIWSDERAGIGMIQNGTRYWLKIVNGSLTTSTTP